MFWHKSSQKSKTPQATWNLWYSEVVLLLVKMMWYFETVTRAPWDAFHRGVSSSRYFGHQKTLWLGSGLRTRLGSTSCTRQLRRTAGGERTGSGQSQRKSFRGKHWWWKSWESIRQRWSPKKQITRRLRQQNFKSRTPKPFSRRRNGWRRKNRKRGKGYSRNSGHFFI